MQFPIKLLIGVSIFLFIILQTLAWQEHKEEAYNEIQDDILSLHSLKIENIQNWSQERRRDINYIRNNQRIADLISTQIQGEPAASVPGKVASLLLPMKLNHDYTAMWVFNASHNLITSINDENVMLDSVILVKTFTLSELDSIYSAERVIINNTVTFQLYIYSPIIHPVSKKLAGFVIFLINVDDNLLPVINFLSGYQEDYNNLLIHVLSDSLIYTSRVDGSGQTIVQSNEIKQNRDLIEIRVLEKPGQLVGGKTAMDEEVVGLCKRIPESNWYILSTTPLKNIEARINERNLSYLLFYLSIFLGLIFLLVLIWLRIEKKKDSERQQFLEQYEIRLKNAGDIILLTNQSGRIVEANQAALDKYGYSFDQIIEMYFSDIRPLSLRREIPSINIEKEQLLVEEVHRCKDGNTFPAEVITTRLNIRNEWFDQRIIRDITERKRKEWLAKEGEENYQFLVENIRDVPYQLRYDTNEYVYISPVVESVTGYTPDEIRKGKFHFMVKKRNLNEKYQIPRDELVAKFLSGEFSAWSADYLIQRKDGAEIWLSDVSRPWMDEKGNVIGSIGLLRDITESKIVEAELNRARQHAEEMNKMKSSFLANMSHELRTPLIGIMGYAEIIQDLTDEEEIKRMASVIFGSGTRLKNTLNMILDLARIEAGKMEINIQRIDIFKIINEVITLFKGSAEKKGLYLKFEHPQEVPEVYTDSTLIIHIMTNLMNNALKFTHQGGITVVYRSDKSSFHISVHDTGIGISKKDQELIWQEFRQASEGLDRIYEGTGLGLAITKSMVEKLSGSIELSSIPGEGSTFTVSIPQVVTEK